ncbi:spondin-1-like [Antedon mediterranea]|uniref:spondin-1-like n=1 Tax=Antedon mediterranea TaxID=105859 RepID=UPI003AF9B8E1
MEGKTVVIAIVILVFSSFGLFIGGMIFGNERALKNVIDCTYSEWDLWSPCHSQRGENGTRYRVRNILEIDGSGSLTCFQPTFEKQLCNEKLNDCEYSNWGFWSACYSPKCGETGKQFRIRNVLGVSGICSKPTTEERTCEDRCGDCEYSDWGFWSACYSSECGESGTQFRVRNVLEVSGICSKSTTEERSCKERCSDCEYSDWGLWSDCSHECGNSGTKFRARNVLKVCGICSEPTTEEHQCNRFCYNEGKLTNQGFCECPKSFSGQCCGCKNTDCQLSTWTEWSSCENSTSRVRSRDVLRESECAGTKCEGPYTEEQNCGVALKGKVLVSKPGFIALNIITAIVLIWLICLASLMCRHRNVRVQKKIDDGASQEKESFNSPEYRLEEQCTIIG